MRTRTPRLNRRTSTGLTALGAASLLLLAACGGSSGGEATTSAGAGGGGDKASAAVVKTRAGDGGQMVLVDAKGRTLYGADQDTSTSVTCTQDCLGFWFPLTTSGGTPSGDGLPAGKLGTVKRPDNGQTQVTFDGHPLYTFKLDTSAGMTSGDGVSDSFGGTKFSWHTMTTAGLGSSGSSDSGGGDDGGVYGY